MAELLNGQMMELADMHDSKSCAERHEGSTPSLATTRPATVG